MKRNKAILNVSIGSGSSWYHKGQLALIKSLDGLRDDDTSLVCRDYEEPANDSPYDDKVQFIRSTGMYYDMILWLDCSITAVRPLHDIWKYLEEHGVYLYQSGANCAQTCNDHSLESYGLTRDEAELIPECASNVVGINLKHPKGRDFYNNWVSSLENGANKGYKWPNEYERISESIDPRFKYHRQDQSSASLSAYLAGVKLEPEGHFVVRHENLERHKNDSIMFVLRGGVGE